MKRVLVGISSFLFSAGNCFAQQTATDSLTVRNAHAMIYHEARGTRLLFGGADERQVWGDLWEWDGARWLEIKTVTPSARAEASMVYDSRRKRLVLFGGHDGDNIFGDMWEWDGRSWSRVIFMPPRMRVDNGH